MASSELTSVPAWLTGCTYDADGGDDLRNSTVTPFFYPVGPADGGANAGVLRGVLGPGLDVQAASGMSITVQGGSFVAAATVPANGGYTATLANQATLTVAASDTVNPRIDLVCATVIDNGDGSSHGTIQVITGTPGASPAEPALPATSVPLAFVGVPANATSVTSGDMTDLRLFSCAVGGVLNSPIDSTPAGYDGAYGYDHASDRLYHNAASGPRQPVLLPSAPVHTLIAPGFFIAAGGPNTIASCSVATDGDTDLKIALHIPGIEQTAGSTTGDAKIFAEMLIDSALVGFAQPPCYLWGAGGIANGFDFTAYTSSDAGNTPDAGTHAVSVTLTITAPGSNTFETAYTGGYLRVEPVGL